MSTKKILVTPGDGIGPEVTEQAILVLKNIAPRFGAHPLFKNLELRL